MVYFRDGSVVAQHTGPDMRTPISYALAWPERLHWASERLDLAAMDQLTFKTVDTRRFTVLRWRGRPCLMADPHPQF